MVKAACELRQNPDQENNMPSTGLHGPHGLTTATIDTVVKGVGPGAYALGRNTSTGFYVDYVGRSDTDLNDRLKDWVTSKYTDFMYGFLPSAKDAFLKECQLYHDFGGGTQNLDNDVHPARPQGTNLTCPVAGCRG